MVGNNGADGAHLSPLHRCYNRHRVRFSKTCEDHARKYLNVNRAEFHRRRTRGIRATRCTPFHVALHRYATTTGRLVLLRPARHILLSTSRDIVCGCKKRRSEENGGQRKRAKIAIDRTVHSAAFSTVLAAERTILHSGRGILIHYRRGATVNANSYKRRACLHTMCCLLNGGMWQNCVALLDGSRVLQRTKTYLTPMPHILCGRWRTGRKERADAKEEQAPGKWMAGKPTGRESTAFTA